MYSSVCGLKLLNKTVLAVKAFFPKAKFPVFPLMCLPIPVDMTTLSLVCKLF